jgi:nitroimidazol reductase NimA-like FMN-containing flavoprotein (pyridoxamine 5'-phosphate oxidase superfamily)
METTAMTKSTKATKPSADRTDARDSIEAVLTDTGTCILGCLDSRGDPYLIPLLYEYADGGIYLVALERANWPQYLKQNGRVALYITGGACRVLIQGHAQQVDEPVFMRRLLEKRLKQKPSSAKSIAETGVPTWFFVHMCDLQIQRGTVWRRHNPAPQQTSVQSSVAPS